MRILFLLLAMLGSTLGVTAAENWPRTFPVDGMTVTIYQPQPESLKGTTLTGRAAMSVKSGSADPVFGAFFFTATIETDRESRLVSLTKLEITSLRITGMEEAQTATLKKAMVADIMSAHLTMKQEELAATLESAQREDLESKELKNEPPKILIAEKPTMLVICEGEPSFIAVETASGVERVVNTVAPVLRYQNTVYIPDGARWYAASTVKGPYSVAASVPKQLTDLVKIEDTTQTGTSNKIVEIIIATEPSEIIVSDGAPKYKPVVGQDLLMMTNTENFVFVDTKSNKTYVLFSGRWFAAASLKGPWTFVPSDKLPSAFRNIPASSEAGEVRPFVAGTNEALDAVLDAYIPQTAAVDRKTASLSVRYDGEPKFEAIGTTGMQYAVNTTTSVLLINGVYYAVDNGIWFTSTSAKGPWVVSDVRPKEVDSIPASSPVYNTKYVYIYDATPTVVYVGYTPGYMGTYIYGPTIVYGTGFYYHGWYGHYYYPHPYTYGFHMHYNPYYGWGGGFSYSYGWMHMSFHYGGYHGWYHPYHAGCWGPARYRPPYAYRGPYARPHPHTAYPVNRSNNLYNRPNNPNRGSVSAARPTTQPAVTGSRQRAASNNVYATPNGDVMKRSGSSWQQYDNNQWRNSSNSTMQRDAQARDRSASSSTRANTMNRSTPTRAATPTRSGGGGRRR